MQTHPPAAGRTWRRLVGPALPVAWVSDDFVVSLFLSGQIFAYFNEKEVVATFMGPT